MTTDVFRLSQKLPSPLLNQDLSPTGATSGAGIAYPSGEPEIIPGF